jgi:phosphomannomutase
VTAPVNPEIFKAYDVRGRYPEELNEDVFRDIGRAFVAFLGARRIGVGRDMRLSSPSLSAALVEGARTQGADIVDFGLIGTDMLYYGVASEGLDGGAQITASHNPKEYNGAKLVGREAFPLSGDSGISDIREMLMGGTIPAAAPVQGHVTESRLLSPYVRHLLGFIDVDVIQPFKVVLDAGCGMAGLVAPPLFSRLPCRTVPLCFTIDGTFPTHEANPLIEENRADIVARVVAEKADLGIAWDGDADRCFFIDGAGEFVSGDFVTALLAEAFLLKQPGATVIYDLRASYAVRDVAARYGGRALMNRVGHAFFKRRMREENAVFGGEVTGHYYFRDNFYADNGFIPALLMLELMSKKKQSLSELLEPLRKRYFISGEINTKLGSMAEVPAKLEAIASRYSDARLARMDGISVEYPNWHFNVRPSNTEPLLRLNLEAATEQLMEQKRDEVIGLIRA